MDKKAAANCHNDRIHGSPQQETVRIFIRIMRRHHACVERRIGTLGIHHSQHRLLMHLARRQEEIPSQKELAQEMGISPAAVATTLKRLEKEGYIARNVTDLDNRKNEIRITERGLSKVMESREIFEDTDKELFDGFSPEELNTLISFLQRIDRNLDAAGAPSDPLSQPPSPSHQRKEENL